MLASFPLHPLLLNDAVIARTFIGEYGHENCRR
jgi:hypothetical protein